MQQHCIEAVIINGYDLRVMRMGYFAFLVHPLVRAASGAGIAFSSGNEWYIFSLVTTSMTVLDNGTRLGISQQKDKFIKMSRMTKI